MPAGALFVFSSYVAQAGATILLAIVLVAFHRMYRRDYLLQWAWSWWAMTVFLVAAALGLYLATFLEASHPARLVATMVSLAAGYLQVAWLLLGTHEVATGRVIERRTARLLLAVVAVVGLASAWLFTGPHATAQARFLLRVGGHALVAGVAFVVAGVVLLRIGSRSAGIGRRMVSGSFLLYGTQQLHYAALSVYQAVTRDAPSYSAYLSLADVVLQSLCGLGLVIWLLEEERARVVDTARQADIIAFSDTLTGLPNRRLFLDRLRLALAFAQRSRDSVAVLAIDVDRFRVLNDTLGYAGGDELLRAVGDRFRHVVRGGDTVARVGADEFAVLLPGVGDDQIEATARRIQGTLAEPFHVQRQEVHLSASVGIAAVAGGIQDAEDVLAKAELTMALARGEGRGGVRHYNPTAGEVARDRLTLEADLHHARQRGEFLLHFQPIVDMRDGRPEALEALLRWQHPERGLLPPMEFLPLAESSGVMPEIAPWVLLTACQQLREIRAGVLPDLRIAINLTARSFSDPELIGHVTHALLAAGLSPDALELEITETVAMQNAEVTRSVLRALKEVGIRLAIDDFGTGYSSLSYLRSFPFDTLKLDRSFVEDLTHDPRAVAICASIIRLAHDLDIAVVAEGVETEEQRFLLLRLGCDRMQGFLFSRGLPAMECRALLASVANVAPARLRLIRTQ